MRLPIRVLSLGPIVASPFPFFSLLARLHIRPLDTYNLGLAQLVQLFHFQKRILDEFVYGLRVVWAAGECIVMTIWVSLSFF